MSDYHASLISQLIASKATFGPGLRQKALFAMANRLEPVKGAALRWRLAPRQHGTPVQDTCISVGCFTANKGTVVLFNSSTIHSGLPIREGRRYALTNYFCDRSINMHMQKMRAKWVPCARPITHARICKRLDQREPGH